MTVPPPAPAYCTEVTPDCPVEGTIYGYYPSLGWNAAYAGFFGLALIIHIILGIRYKTWSYCIAMSLGCIGEVVGYIGRVMMWDNPFSEEGFQMQICCLIIAPAFISAAIYLTLKHIVYSFGCDWSRVKPSWYTWIFIGCDLLSLVLQGAGGGIAATSDFGSELQDVGTDLMLAGVVWQVVCLTFFGYFLGEYLVRTYRHRNEIGCDGIELLHDRKFQLFVGAIITAIPELSDGWRSEIMRDEVEFIVLEGAMIVTAVAALTVFHPGYCFPVLATGKRSEGPKSMTNIEEGIRLDSLA
ncbi:hypothetical protein N0V91_001391 [Didymella pomorum]|uniref:Uncharacterized protein n=1 Tax=Didymella pomorum TaxID=749634 RepID=A0A9W9DBC9_9PLEO|nr:hypothetical protein N0V91_001391 [Didymella pomorum]